MSAFPVVMPTPRTPDPMAAPALRWGVIGPGWIAERFIRRCSAAPGNRCSRSAPGTWPGRPRSPPKHGIERAYGSYADLLADPDVDVVYIATPHNAHYPCALQSLRAGKHTLVEKPIALNAAQAGELAGLAAAQGVFFMEALWTMFLPKFDVIRQLLDDRRARRDQAP